MRWYDAAQAPIAPKVPGADPGSSAQWLAATPLSASVAFTVTSAALTYHGLLPGVPLMLSVVEGAVLSTLKAALVLPAAVLPATSEHPSDVTVTVVPSPLVVFVCVFPTPENAVR